MLAVVTALLPLGVLVKFAMGGIPLTVLGILPAVLVSLMPAALLIPAIMVREVRFDGRELLVKATFHTRRKAVAELDLDAAEIVDLRERKDLRPLLRLFGFQLIGFQAGHFWTRTRRRVFALVTSGERVLALPERDGPVILVSVERPEQLLQSLRSA